MATVFFVFFIIASIHFIYNSIILPELRLELRYSLFEMRDKLRMIKCDEKREIDEEVFNYLNHAINISINYIPNYNIGLITEVQKEIKRNPELKKHIEKRISMINDCKDSEIKSIFYANAIVSSVAFVFNSLGWLAIPLLIIIPCLWILKQINSIKAESIKKRYIQKIEHTNYIYKYEFPGIYEKYNMPDKSNLMPA